MKHDLPAFAVLIDADNVCPDTISPILEEITRHGRATVRRIYGDFTTQNLAGWRTKLAEHAIQPIQQYPNTKGKNASDSALIIDAMDLLHSRRFDGFCLVSSDSDFTRLATRIREDGLVVYGFGENKAPKAFVKACDHYIYVENLLAPVAQENLVVTPAAEVVDLPPAPQVSVAPQAVAQVSSDPLPSSSPAGAPEGAKKPAFKAPALARELLLKAYTSVADEQGWAMLGQLSSYIHANHSDFDPRSYGCAKFIELLQKTGAFELAERPHKNGQTYFCRPRHPRSSTAVIGERSPGVMADYKKALVAVVVRMSDDSGWTPLNAIRQALHAQGRQVKESGFATVGEALMESGLFEMQGKGVERCFRVKKSNWHFSSSSGGSAGKPVVA